MKKLSFLVCALAVVSLLGFAAPAAASAGNPVPVGERIGLFSSASLEFPAGIPFNIRHGWNQPSTDEAIGIFDFHLEIDGALLPDGLRMFSSESGDPDILYRMFVYNFPAGMTGTHTFTGHWYAPCKYAVETLGYTGTCTTPNQKVETNSRSRTVIFVP